MIWHIKQILIAFDQGINALMGGWADETISSRAWRKGWYRPIDFMFGTNHCQEAYESEQQRRQLPPELRK